MAFIGGFSSFGAVGAVSFNQYGGGNINPYAQSAPTYNQGQVRQSLTAGFQLQSSWGGFLGSNYNYPTQPSYGGGGSGYASGFSYGGNNSPYASSGFPGTLAQGYADVPGFGIITPFGQQDTITGPLGYGTLTFPPTGSNQGTPFYNPNNGAQGIFATNYPETTRGESQLGLFGGTPAFEAFGGFPNSYSGYPGSAQGFGASFLLGNAPQYTNYGLPGFFG